MSLHLDFMTLLKPHGDYSGTTNVTQNNTGMYTKESSKQTVKKYETTIQMKDLKELTKTIIVNSIDQKEEQGEPQFIMEKGHAIT